MADIDVIRCDLILDFMLLMCWWLQLELTAVMVSVSLSIAHIWSIASLIKCAAPLINLSNAQHLTNCTIFGQSCSALAIGLVLGLRLGLGLGLVLELGLGIGFHNWSNVQRV